MKYVFVIRAVTGEGGGAEKVFAQAVNGLSAGGTNIEVLSFDSPGKAFYPLGNVPLTFLSLCHPNKSLTPLTFIRLIFSLRKYLLSCAADVVVGFMHSAYVPLIIASIGTGIKVIGSEHAPKALYKKKKAQSILMNIADRLLWRKTVTSQLELARQSLSVVPKTFVVSNPVAIRLDSSTRCIDKSDNVGSLLCVGTLRAEKRFDVVIKAFSRCVRDTPGWTLNFVGDGPERGNLESLVASLDLQHKVFFCGAVKDPLPYYLRSDLLIVSSEYESFGLVALEALSLGVPVVSFSRCEGVLEFVSNGNNGVILDAGPSPEVSLQKELSVLMNDNEKLLILKNGASNFDCSAYDLASYIKRWIVVLDPAAEA